ncbi:hypothetical protein EMIT043CA1_80099 [Pseudomonas brassicacearum]
MNPFIMCVRVKRQSPRGSLLKELFSTRATFYNGSLHPKTRQASHPTLPHTCIYQAYGHFEHSRISGPAPAHYRQTSGRSGRRSASVGR